MLGVEMSDVSKIYVLIHGAWHGSWCWKDLVPELLVPGVDIITPTLPGHGSDETPFSQINLQTYVKYISAIVEEQEKPVILVGHSMAGVIISQVAENVPHKIACLVYLAAFLPEDQSSLLDEVKKSKSNTLALETRINRDVNEIALINSNRLIDIFYNNCSAEQAHFALSHLQKEPYQPFLDPIEVTKKNFAQVRKIYVECLQDKTILIEDQRRMHTRADCQVVSLNTDHSPFFSDPVSLSGVLHKL